LIGGGVNGSLQQVLLHPSISHVDYVELDPMIIELSRQYLPAAATTALTDARVHIWNVDGRLFMRQTPIKYDVIIVNLPDPETTLINRFYTLEFYQLAKKNLAEDGMLSFSVTSSENVIGHDLANFLSCLYHTLLKVFPDIMLIPGDTNHFIACTRKGVLPHDAQQLVERLLARKLDTVYLREYYIPYRMSPERVLYLYNRLQRTSAYALNQDFKPVGNFHQLIVWTTYFSKQIKNIFYFLSRWGFNIILLLCLALFLPFLIKLKSRSLLPYGILTSISIVGFSQMSLEVIIIMSFQAIYGYVYFQIALILSNFMMGMAAGSYVAINSVQQGKSILSQLKIFQLLMALFPLLFIFLIQQAAYISGQIVLLQLIYFLLTIAAGFIGGYVYPLASHLYCAINPNIERAAGILYASDLLGAAIGAIITSALLIPVLGIIQTCMALMLINLTIFLGLLLIKK